MNIGIFGTGGVGQAFATRLTALGHHVILGTRNATDKKNDNAFAEYLQRNPDVALQDFNTMAGNSNLLINAGKGSASVDILGAVEPGLLDGKVLIDLSNPLDFSKGMPPSLLPGLSNTNSLGEEIQRRFPGLRVVKTFNTMWNGIMLQPDRLSGGKHVNFICGNDAAAKAEVMRLLHRLGWTDDQLVDLGDITAARATEAMLPIWLRLYGLRKTGAFNFSLVWD